MENIPSRESTSESVRSVTNVNQSSEESSSTNSVSNERSTGTPKSKTNPRRRTTICNQNADEDSTTNKRTIPRVTRTPTVSRSLSKDNVNSTQVNEEGVSSLSSRQSGDSEFMSSSSSKEGPLEHDTNLEKSDSMPLSTSGDSEALSSSSPNKPRRRRIISSDCLRKQDIPKIIEVHDNGENRENLPTTNPEESKLETSASSEKNEEEKSSTNESEGSFKSTSEPTKYRSHKNSENSSGFNTAPYLEISTTPSKFHSDSNTEEPDGSLARKVEPSKPWSLSSLNKDPLEDDVFVSRKDEEEELIEAALDGDIDTVNRLLDDEVNIEAVSCVESTEGVTPLLAASWSGEYKVVKLLLERRADRKAIANGLSAVHYAAKGGHVNVLQHLWDAGSNIRKRSASDSTPLHLAADNGNLEAVKWLVERGALLQVKDKKGFTPEECAKDSGHQDVEIYLHDKNQELRMNDLSEKKTLGKGAYGEVYLVKRNGKNLVLKSVNLSALYTKKKKEYALQEINLLKSLSHPYIVSYLGGGCKGDYIYIQMEFCSGGDLAKKIDAQKEKKIPFEEQQIVNWSLRLGLALKYIHGRKILHRDIKPQNIFLTGNFCIKLGDFGLSKVLENDSQACTSLGSAAYMGPEVFKGQPYDSAADMWAFGSVMFEMAALKVAYPHKNLEMPNFSQEYKEAVMSLLQREPQNRLSADKLLRLPIFHDTLESQLPEKEHHITELKEEIDGLNHDIEDYLKEIEIRDTAIEELRKNESTSDKGTGNEENNSNNCEL